MNEGKKEGRSWLKEWMNELKNVGKKEGMKEGEKEGRIKEMCWKLSLKTTLGSQLLKLGRRKVIEWHQEEWKQIMI